MSVPVLAHRVRAAPAAVAELAPEYWDCYAISSEGALHRPSLWARTALGGADAANGVFAQVVWHRLMGFELATPGTEGTLAGWQIVADGDDLLVLDADGPRTTGRMVFACSDDGVEWMTMLSHHTPAARRVWSVLGHAHRTIAPLCLVQARLRLAG